MIELTIEGGIARLTLSRAPVNAISSEWTSIFGNKLDELAARDDWRLLHIRSNQKAFCAGGDLLEMRRYFDAADGADRMSDYVAAVQTLFARIESLAQVTLVETGGAAMGGGLELALACDLRIVANEASIGLPEARLGLIPGAGGTQRLTRLCGPAVAARLILAGEVIDGAEAAAIGIAQWAVPRAELEARANAIANAVAELSKTALAEAKMCIAAVGPLRDGFRLEREATRRLFGDTQTRSRIGNFLRKSRAAE